MALFTIKNAILTSFALLSLFLCIKTLWNLFFACKKRCKQKGLGRRGFYTIELIRPAIFFKLFASCLTIAALPQYFVKIAALSGKTPLAASYLYVMYQTIYILMIVPGGFLVEAKNLKRIYILVTLGEILAWLLLGLAQGFWSMLFIQIFFGCLIPLSSAVDYAYIFKLSSEKQRNEAIALYSNTLRGATIAGIFTGGFLVTYLGIQAVFLIASGIVFLCGIYALHYFPKIKPKYNIQIKRISLETFKIKTLIKQIPLFLKDKKFLKTAVLIGFIFGLLKDGVALFSIPLLLAHYHFTQVETGAVLLLFSIGFFLSNKYISKKADKSQKEELFIFLGLLGSAGSLMLIAMLHPGIVLGWLQTIRFMIAMLGLLFLGGFWGFLFSPAVSIISKNLVATKAGKNVALSFYKLFQTLGRILGPILMINLLVCFKYSTFIYMIISALLVLFSLAFVNSIKFSKRKVHVSG